MRIRFVVLDESHSKVLFHPSQGTLELPHMDIPDSRIDPCDTQSIGRLAQHSLGIDLEPLYAMDLETPGEPAIIASFEARAAGESSTNAWGWLDRDSAEMKGCPRGILSTAELELVPWLKPGMVAEAADWISERLSLQGVTVMSDVEHVKSSYVGKVLRVETNAGRFYFKATPAIYAREVAITSTVSCWFPDRVPCLIAADSDRRWMLTREVVGPTLAEVDDVGTWENALRAYARLQRHSIHLLAKCSENPFYDCRCESLVDAIDPMMADLETLQEGCHEPLSGGEIESPRSLSSRIEDACKELENWGVPWALEHNDLHPGNIRLTDDGPVFLDWAWSSVAHPFLSLCLVLHEKQAPTNVRQARDSLQRAYLEEWAEYGSMDHLEALYRLVEKWRVIQYAASDYDWLASYQRELRGRPVLQNTYLSWTLRQRQFQLVKTLRRILLTDW